MEASTPALVASLLHPHGALLSARPTAPLPSAAAAEVPPPLEALAKSLSEGERQLFRAQLLQRAAAATADPCFLQALYAALVDLQ